MKISQKVRKKNRCIEIPGGVIISTADIEKSSTKPGNITKINGVKDQLQIKEDFNWQLVHLGLLFLQWTPE